LRAAHRLAVTGIDPSDAQIAYARERQSVKMRAFASRKRKPAGSDDNSF